MVGGYNKNNPKIEKYYLIYSTSALAVFLLYSASLSGADFAFNILAVLLIGGLYLLSLLGLGIGHAITALIQFSRDTRAKKMTPITVDFFCKWDILT